MSSRIASSGLTNRLRSIGARLAASFGGIVLVMCTVAAATVVLLHDVEDNEHSLIETRLPALLDGEKMFVALGQSFTHLRDYLLLGEPSLREERRKAWAEFEASRARLTSHLAAIPGREFTSDLATIDSLCTVLERLQTSIEEVSATPDNFPALELYESEAAPASDRMLAAITALIDEEKQSPADAERKALLANFADSRGSIATAVAALRAYVVSGEPSQRTAFEQRFGKNGAALSALETQTHLFSDEQKRQWDEYCSARQSFASVPARLLEIRESSDWNVAHAMLREELASPTANLRDAVSRVMKSLQDVVQADAASTLANVKTVSRFVAWGSVFCAVLALVIAFRMSRSILGRTRHILAVSSRIAEGDLTARAAVAGSDEITSIGESLDRAFTGLQELVKRIRASCEQVGAAALELATVSNQVRGDAQEVSKQAATASAGATQVSGSTQSVAAAVEQLSKSTQDITRNVTEVTSIAAQAGTVAADANSSIKRLDAVAQKIGSVSKLISSIAGQTNLLALNATIEAARAGESGKGFAVVATEVKSLATATGDATGEITSQIASVQFETATSVELLGSVSEVIRQINEAQQSIASAVEEQNATTHEITRNVSAAAAGTLEIERCAREVARSAESTLGVVEHTHVASENLSRMAEELRSTIAGFKV